MFSLPYRNSRNFKHCTICGIQFDLFHSKVIIIVEAVQPIPEYLINLLKVTKADRELLNTFNVKSLKRYTTLHNISTDGAITKEDLIELIIRSRPLTKVNIEAFRGKIPQPSENSGSNTNSMFERFTDGVRNMFDPSSPNLSIASNTSSTSNIRNEAPHDLTSFFTSNPRPNTSTNVPRFQQTRPNADFIAEFIQPVTQTFTTHMNNHTAHAHTSNSQNNRPAHTYTSNSQNNQASSSGTKQDPSITIKEILEKGKDTSSLSVKELKSMLKSNFVDFGGVIEKKELVNKVDKLVKEYKDNISIHPSFLKSLDAPESEDALCKICWDNPINSVILECGHMATCIDCSKKLKEMNNECPVCRERITRVVRVFKQ